MTSAAKIRTNRRNALRSNGPRSVAGKAIAARNSRRHGLSLPVLAEPSPAHDAVEHARRIETSEVGREADLAGHVLACRIAETMIDLKRVRLAKLPLAAALDADPGDDDVVIPMRVADILARRAARQNDKTKPTEKRQ